MIVPREYKHCPRFEITCPGGTLYVTFLDRDKVRITTNHERDYDLGMRGRKYITRGCYIVNGVEHVVDATYIHLTGDKVRGYWYSHIDGEEMPAELWALDKSQSSPHWRREDYYHSSKWVTEAASKRLKNEVYECLRYALSTFADRLDEAHETHMWNELAQIEREVQKHEREIEKLYASMNDIV